MATGVVSDLTIYDDEFYGGMNEVLQQETDAFNAASNNAIRLVPGTHRGNYQKEAFFTAISSLVKRRDNTSVSTDTDDPLASDEKISVKLNRKYQVANTIDSMKKIASNEREFSLLLGEQVGKAKAADYLNTALLAGKVNLINNANVFTDKTGETSKTLEFQYLLDGLKKFGDANQRVIAWVMHSAPFFSLLGEALTVVTDRVAGATIYEGTTGTLGKPVIVTDSSSLIDPTGGGTTPDVNSYYTFGLVADALFVIDSEEDTVATDTVTGLESLVYRIQGEHAYTVGVKGYSYTSATANPDDTALGTSGNWGKVASDDKNTAGIAIETVD